VSPGSAPAPAAGELALRLLERLEDAVLAVDGERRVTYFGPGAERLYAVPATQALGRPLGDVFTWRFDRAEDETAALAVLDGRCSWRGESAQLRRDGTTLRVEATLSPTGDAGGARGFVAVVRDVTEQKRLDEALREADRRRDELLHVLAHELRNPLSPIQDGLFVLARSPAGSDPARRAEAQLTRQVAHLSQLVDDLVGVARRGSGGLELRRERLELGALATLTIEEHRPLFDAADIELSAVVEAARLDVLADRARLAQVLSTLLRNAAHLGEGGVDISLAADRESGKAVMRVHDDGAGFDAESLRHLFEPFTDAHPGLERAEAVTGLALSRVVAEAHGGNLEVESPGRGKGATFTLRLPLAVAASEQAPAPAEARATVASAGGAPLRVLVVEDNVDSAETLRDALELGGRVVHIAHDGDQGLAAARTFEPDVILCDLGLPVTSGYELARRLRANPVPSRPLLVALTGYASPEDVAEARDAGFDHHLAKPLSLDILERLLRDAGTERRA
jgi:PAS domain S-box-containing protein